MEEEDREELYLGGRVKMSLLNEEASRLKNLWICSYRLHEFKNIRWYRHVVRGLLGMKAVK